MLESTRLDTPLPKGSSVEDTSCLGRFWTRSRAANWHRWSCQITRRSSARRAFETMDTSHRLRRSLLAVVRASSHTQGIVNGELVYVWRKVKKNRTVARTALVIHQWYGPASVVGKEKNTVFVSYRGHVTPVAPDCL